MTVMFRKTTCNGCGHSQQTNLTYRQDKKMWQATHTLAFCLEQKQLAMAFS